MKATENKQYKLIAEMNKNCNAIENQPAVAKHSRHITVQSHAYHCHTLVQCLILRASQQSYQEVAIVMLIQVRRIYNEGENYNETNNRN